MNILLIGSGGREHAIAAALKYKNDNTIFAVPGNPGIAQFSKIVSFDIKNHRLAIDFCKQNDIQLIVIGPEQPLADGLSDSLRNAGFDVFGPSKAAAMLEASKDYAKSIMTKYDIPTAQFKSFGKDDLKEAIEYIESQTIPIVIKADGLAAGKGVVIAESKIEAEEALVSIFDGEFGIAGNKVVIEEFMHGEEASIFAICDGNDFALLAPSQDHKRIGDNDTGKNTGGMGAYAPAPIVTEHIIKSVENKVIKPLLQGMKSEGFPYIGCLYVGLMIKDGNARVVEFNCRFGDPETQPVLSIFDGDFASLLLSAACGKLDKSMINNVASAYANCVVLASNGYPDKFQKGYEIAGLDALPSGVFAYQAGTSLENNKIISSGGRVLGITAIAPTLEKAIELSYLGVESISFENMYYRKDIGSKGLKHCHSSFRSE